MKIVRRPRTIAETMIEEFMLAANETVAAHLPGLELPFLYRIHEKPDTEKLQSFFEFITHFGYSIRGQADKVRPRALQQLLEEIEGQAGGNRDQHGDVPLDEAGPICGRVPGPLRFGGQVLYPFHVADPPVPRSDDSPDHPGGVGKRGILSPTSGSISSTPSCRRRRTRHPSGSGSPSRRSGRRMI